MRALLVLASCLAATSADARPRLGVIIIVDQFCADQLAGYSPLFTGGLNRIEKGGVSFSDAHHEHAMTLTATGHATLSTGCYPNRHGIVGNNWYERGTGQRVYCCDDSTVQVIGDPEAVGRSPHYLMTEAIGDWLKSAWVQSKVFTVSQKDRSAILLGGHRPDGAYWFDDAKGRFVTSTYYTDSLPDWVAGYDCFPFREKAIRDGWRKGWPEKTYALANPDDSPAENDSAQSTFPHLYDSAAAVARTPSEWLMETPYSDEMILDFARVLVETETLGQDSVPDLLCISLSANDYIGHSFGPHSQEALDGLLRVDSYLGKFLDVLDKLVGVGQYTLALSSDHGVMPLPEDIAVKGDYAERILRADNKQDYEAAARQVADEFGIMRPLIVGQINGLMLDTKAGEERRVRPPDLRQAVAKALGTIDYIDEVLTYEDLAAPKGSDRGYRALYRQSFHPDRAPDIVIRTKENVLILDSRYGTTHGTPYEYDTHVPLIFWGQGVASVSEPKTDRVRTVDLAPTLAVLLGLAPPAKIDGAVLDDVIAEHAH